VISLRIVVTGRVQGVGFRAAAQKAGTQLELLGWARNQADGAVEIHAQGPAEKIEKFVLWCHRGPPSAVVEEATVATTSPDTGLRGFARR
jgi:acylphosphatase